MSHTWELRDGGILVVEDAGTAALVIVVRDAADRADKIAALKEVLEVMSTQRRGAESAKPGEQ